MRALLAMEFGKLFRLPSIRFGMALLLVFALLWAYAPGIEEVYGFLLVSGFQVPALTLLSSAEFLLPLLVAISSAELLGLEMRHGTLPTVLLRPVSRSQWLFAKLLVSSLYPFLLVAFMLAASLLAGIPFGFGSFVGGTGVGEGGLLGVGVTTPPEATAELLRAYVLAGLSLVPIGILALALTTLFMSAAAGALATLAVLVASRLLVVFPAIDEYLLSTLLTGFAGGAQSLPALVTLVMLYSAAFAALAVLLFERKDF